MFTWPTLKHILLSISLGAGSLFLAYCITYLRFIIFPPNTGGFAVGILFMLWWAGLSAVVFLVSRTVTGHFFLGHSFWTSSLYSLGELLFLGVLVWYLLLPSITIPNLVPGVSAGRGHGDRPKDITSCNLNAEHDNSERIDLDKTSVAQLDDQIIRDIRLIVGGNFTQDALGLEKYNNIRKRVLKRPAKYLDAFEGLYTGVRFDVVEQSELYLHRFLEEIHEGSTEQKVRERVKRVARRLLKRYESVLFLYDNADDKQVVLSQLSDDNARTVRQLDNRRISLCSLAENHSC